MRRWLPDSSKHLQTWTCKEAPISLAPESESIIMCLRLWRDIDIDITATLHAQHNSIFIDLPARDPRYLIAPCKIKKAKSADYNNSKAQSLSVRGVLENAGPHLFLHATPRSPGTCPVEMEQQFNMIHPSKCSKMPSSPWQMDIPMG